MGTSEAQRFISGRRIAAMVERYRHLLRSSWPRLLELLYWPTVQMMMWGFLQLYIGQNSGYFARAGGTFIGAVLLWDILFRGQLGFSVSFLEEMWSRNLANLMMSPLKPIEFVIAMMVMSLVRLAIGMVPVTLLAIGFFGFNLWSLGLALAAFFVNLMVAAADLRVRRHEGAADRPHVPGRPHGAGLRDECRGILGGRGGLHGTSKIGAAQRIAVANRGIRAAAGAAQKGRSCGSRYPGSRNEPLSIAAN